MSTNNSNVSQPKYTNADRFTADKLAWLDQVVADRSLPASAFKLAYVIASHVNRETGDAWPSQATLAKRANLSPRAVRGLLSALERAGHLQIISGKGRRQTSSYRLKRNTVAAFAEEKRKETSTFPEKKRNVVAAFEDEKRNGDSTFPAEKRNVASGECGTQFPTNTYIEHDEDRDSESIDAYRLFETTTIVPLPSRQPESTEGYNEAFEEFWRHYPRRVAKEAARKAFEKLVSSGAAEPQAIIAGAMRYAAERDDQDPKFTKHPRTWLLAHGWQDETLPRTPRTDGGNTAAKTTGRSGMQAALENYGRTKIDSVAFWMKKDTKHA